MNLQNRCSDDQRRDDQKNGSPQNFRFPAVWVESLLRNICPLYVTRFLTSTKVQVVHTHSALFQPSVSSYYALHSISRLGRRETTISKSDGKIEQLLVLLVQN